MGRPAEASDAYQTALRIMGRVPYVLSGLAYSYARAGRRGEALTLLAEMERGNPKFQELLPRAGFE
jgi:pentatricopeptide repeat protein